MNGLAISAEKSTKIAELQIFTKALTLTLYCLNFHYNVIFEIIMQ